MGILIEGTKVYEDDETVTYAYDSPGAEQSGEVTINKAEAEAILAEGRGEWAKAASRTGVWRSLSPTPRPDSGLGPVGAKILVKACKEARATGAWPEKVLYAA